jgi:hypothetical protein
VELEIWTGVWLGFWAKLEGPDNNNKIVATQRMGWNLLEFTGVGKDVPRAWIGIRLLLEKGYHRHSPKRGEGV